MAKKLLVKSLGAIYSLLKNRKNSERKLESAYVAALLHLSYRIKVIFAFWVRIYRLIAYWKYSAIHKTLWWMHFRDMIQRCFAALKKMIWKSRRDCNQSASVTRKARNINTLELNTRGEPERYIRYCIYYSSANNSKGEGTLKQNEATPKTYIKWPNPVRRHQISMPIDSFQVYRRVNEHTRSCVQKGKR